MEAQRQSALHPVHRRAGARLESYGGWHLPAFYTDPTSELAAARASVGISDASHLFKLDLRGQAAELPVTPPAKLWLLTPAHALITSPSPISFASSASVTEVTSLYSAILLAGPKSREVLQRLTTLNVREPAMANGVARQTRLAHVNAIILRNDGYGLPGFLILSTRDVAEHVWESLLHAGSEFSAQPFGMAAQQQWFGGAV